MNEWRKERRDIKRIMLRDFKLDEKFAVHKALVDRIMARNDEFQ